MISENLKPAGKTNRFARPVVLSLLLAVVTLAAYWPVLRCDFVNYDDPDYFFSNPHVLTGLSSANLVWALTTGFGANWHPLTWLSLMLDAEFIGKGPFGPHLTNLLLHAANTVLVFLLFRRLTGAAWRSAFVAALFALHPLHVESVAWVAERKDVLSMFFGLLSLWAYACHAEHLASDGWRMTQTETIRSRFTFHVSRFYWLALLFFALGLMSKPMLVTLPFVMLLLDYWPLGRMSGVGRRASRVWCLVWEKIPLILLSAVSCWVTFLVQRKAGAVVVLTKYSVSSRIGNAFVSYARYLEKTLWPVSLANPYPYVKHWPLECLLPAVALFIMLCVAAAWLGRKFPFGFTGWFWFVGTLIPVIGLVQVGSQSMADRYSYLPLVGLFVILAWGGGELWLRRCWPKPLLVLAAGLLLAAGAWQTRIQLGYWQNTEQLFLHAMAVTQNNIIACNKLGSFYSRQGRMTEAMDYYARALQINPDDPDVLYDQGNAFAQRGDWDGAINSYRHALQVTPDQPDILNNLGFALAAKKQYAEAVVNFEAALKLKPDSASTHNNFAGVLFIQHRFEEAARHYREALRLMPDDPRIFANLGDVFVRLGQIPDATRCYQEALRLKPDDVKIKAKLQALGAPALN